MDSLLGMLPELVTAAAAAGATYLRQRKARKVAAELVLEFIGERMHQAGDIGVRFADALRRGDLKAMRAIEAERKRRGL